MILLLFLVTMAFADTLPSGIYCDGYDYPEIETPVTVVDAKKASAMAIKNRAGEKDIQAFKEAINTAIGKGMLEVLVRVPREKFCPQLVHDYFSKLGYTVISDNAECLRKKKRCPDWGYCIIRWGKP